VSFTYDLAVIATSEKDQVRLLIGDTDSTDVLLQDEEINYFLTAEGSVYAAAVAGCKSIAASLNRQPGEFWAGSVRISNSDRANEYLKMAETLQRRNTLISARPFAGGISKADKETRENDSDRVKPSFTRALHTPPGENFGSLDGWNSTDERV